MTKSLTVQNIDELEKYKRKIQENLDKCCDQLRVLLSENDALGVFMVFKFEKSVTEPLSGEAENLIEVINQSMTYLVSVKAVEYLYGRYPDEVFTINWGNIPGYDIESKDGAIIGECFAATSYRSNNKLSKDLKRLKANESAVHKYEFFYDREFTENHRAFYLEKYRDVKIVKFDKLD